MMRAAALRAAVDAVHAGDAAALAALLDAEPGLVHATIDDPDVYRSSERFAYFAEPKLVWFAANNPILVPRMPPNIAEIVRLLIGRGTRVEDLTYALELTMSGCSLREQELQRPVMRALLAGGARVTERGVEVAAGHRETDALAMLVEEGHPPSATIAAALGDAAALRGMLAALPADRVQSAFGIAAINGRIDAVRLLLDAGAAVNGPLPVHAHGSALHQAALGADPALIALLLERGADRAARDTLWDGTPLDWAEHAGNASAAAALREQ